MKIKFYYVYILYSQQDKQFYIGFTQDLKQRYFDHQQGKVPSTAPRLPLELVFYEAYRNQYDALRRENYFKSTKGKTTLNSMLREFINGLKKES